MPEGRGIRSLIFLDEGVYSSGEIEKVIRERNVNLARLFLQWCISNFFSEVKS
jgi:hypothetical protein